VPGLKKAKAFIRPVKTFDHPSGTLIRPAHSRGRPKLGSYRLETILPAAALDELKKREAQTGVYRTRIAANMSSTK
jgi:hypothetical protein